MVNHGKSTISMAIFNSYVSHYQGVYILDMSQKNGSLNLAVRHHCPGLDLFGFVSLCRAANMVYTK